MAKTTTSNQEPGTGRKRKRIGETCHAQLKPREIVQPAQVDFQGRALQLEEKILASRTNYNDIHTLLGYLQSNGVSEEEEMIIAAVTLCRVFCKLMARGNLSKTQEASSNEATIVHWLKERLQDYEQALLRMLRNANAVTQSTALTMILRLFKEQALNLDLSEKAVWQNGVFGHLIRTLVEEEVVEETRLEFVEKYVEGHEDVRYYTFACLGDLNSNSCPDVIVQNTLVVLAAIEPIPEQHEKTGDFYLGAPNKATHELYSLTAHKKQAQKAWMALLRQDLSTTQRKLILELTSHRIAPWFLKVEFLMDFLTDSFNVGGSTSLLSLSGLFHLMQHKNLDYPQFYLKLYSLLDSNILHSKYRSGFFRLLDTFLASTHLPAALVASFIKRLARLSLFAPPSGIIIIVPWIYNLLKNHPNCTFMIHRVGEVDRNEGMWGDPFRQEESDPYETQALKSSLWEIQMLQSHYHPNVATIAKIISEQFTKQAYSTEDFLDHSYGTMLDLELTKTIKKPPEIEFEIPKKIFTKHDTGSVKDNLLVKLWGFG